MRKEPNYLYLMLSLLAAVVLITAASPQSLLGVLGVSTGVFTVMMVTAYILAEHKRQMLVAGVLAALAFAPFVWINLHPQTLSPGMSNVVYTVNLGFWLLFTVYNGVIAFRSIMSTGRVSGNHIYGAIYLYLVIGVMFAEIYQVLLAWQPDALYFDPARFPATHVTEGRLYTRGAGDALYYSFVTLGTVGYGDVTPASPFARSLSLIESVTGIMYVATMIARFVSIHTSSVERQRPDDG